MNRDELIQMLVRIIIVAGIILILSSFYVLTARAGQVTLAWDENNPVPDGYRVFMRTAGSQYNFETPVWTGQAITCTIEGLQPTEQYYFVVRAYMGSDESGDSNEVDYKPGVPAPANLRIDIEIAVFIDVNGVPYVAATAKQ